MQQPALHVPVTDAIRVELEAYCAIDRPLGIENSAILGGAVGVLPMSEFSIYRSSKN
jgi:hypothetical protein